MANEFWNTVVGIIAGVIIGLVIHSSAGHTYGRVLWEIFHRGELPKCYGHWDKCEIHNMIRCEQREWCKAKCRTSTG